MNNNYIALSSLAMDLDRVSSGLYRKSYKMAAKFTQEALKRKREVDKKQLKPYVLRLLDRMEEVLKATDDERKAEDVLMYSTLFQNAALKLRK